MSEIRPSSRPMRMVRSAVITAVLFIIWKPLTDGLFCSPYAQESSGWFLPYIGGLCTLGHLAMATAVGIAALELALSARKWRRA